MSKKYGMTSYLHKVRRHVGHEKIILVFATACVLNEEGHLLWQRRADFGWWGLPGGILEWNESLPECVVREVREETGLEVEPKRLIGIYTSPDFDVTYPNGDLVQQVTLCFQCRVIGGKLVADKEETLDLAWFPPDRRPSTSVWYRAMSDDLSLDQRMAAFDRGDPGSPMGAEPFFHHIRRRIGEIPLILPVAYAFIRNSDVGILLSRNGHTNQWGLPAIHMTLGERIDQTLARGLLLESGWMADVVRLIGVYREDSDPFTKPENEGIRKLSVLFNCRLRDQALHAEAIGASEYRLFPSDALPPLSEFHLLLLKDGLADHEDAVF